MWGQQVLLGVGAAGHPGCGAAGHPGCGGRACGAHHLRTGACLFSVELDQKVPPKASRRLSLSRDPLTSWPQTWLNSKSSCSLPLTQGQGNSTAGRFWSGSLVQDPLGPPVAHVCKDLILISTEKAVEEMTDLYPSPPLHPVCPTQGTE